MYLKGIKIKNDNEAGLLYAYDSKKCILQRQDPEGVYMQRIPDKFTAIQLA